MDPELEAFVPLIPDVDMTDPATARKLYAELAAARPAVDMTGMDVEDRIVPADPDVPVRIYRPRQAQGAVIWLHGGGWMMGDLDTEHAWAARVAEGSGAVVVSVGYRLAPENPFPAAHDDVYAVLNWTAEHAAELGIDPARIAIGGHSAGGNLAAGVALRARDEQGPPICFQVLNEAALDDRQETWSARNFTDTPWSTRDKITVTWQHYLGAAPAQATMNRPQDLGADAAAPATVSQPQDLGADAAAPATANQPQDSAAVSPYAAPARATDLSGLPPAYVAAAEFCPDRDEDIEYAQRLLQAGVSVELHQWAGTFHGSQAILSAAVSQRQIAAIGGALRRALAE